MIVHLNEYINDEIRVEGVKIELKKIKLGKAAGCDEIAPQIIKFLNIQGINILTKIYNIAWNDKSTTE